MLAIRRIDGFWALPGALSPSPDIALANVMKKAFGMDHKLLPVNLRKEISEIQSLLQRKSRHVYHGYVDDGRNTDNAWIETQATHFHDDDDFLGKLEILDCADQSMYIDGFPKKIV